MHKPGSKHDSKTFESNYKEQVDKWKLMKSIDKESVSPSFGRARLSDGYGLVKPNRKSVVEVSLESKLETLKRKYTSTGKDDDKPVKVGQLMPQR